MKALNNKGNISGLQSFIMGIIGITVVLAIGFIVLTETRSSIALCSTGFAYNDSANNCYEIADTSNTTTVANQGGQAITSMITKLGTVPNWIGIIIVVALASLVLAYFYVRQ
jgi:hypothetical protein